MSRPTRNNLWNEYKNITPMQDRMSYRTATRGNLQTALRQQVRQNLTQQLIPQISNRQRRGLFTSQILPQIQRFHKHTYIITPSLTIVNIKANTTGVEIIESSQNPIIYITQDKPLSKDKKKRKREIFRLIQNYINKLRPVYGYIRLYNNNQHPPINMSRHGIYYNNKYKSLQKDTTYNLQELAKTGKVKNTFNNLTLRQYNEPKLYSLGLESTWNTKEGQCVLNGLLHTYKDSKRFQNMTRESILNEMELPENTTDVSIYHIKQWYKKKDISLYMLDINNTLKHKFISKNKNSKPSFIKVANDHSYFIDDEDLQSQIIHNSNHNIIIEVEWKNAIIESINGTLKDILPCITKLSDKDSENDKVLFITNIEIEGDDTKIFNLNMIDFNFKLIEELVFNITQLAP